MDDSDLSAGIHDEIEWAGMVDLHGNHNQGAPNKSRGYPSDTCRTARLCVEGGKSYRNQVQTEKQANLENEAIHIDLLLAGGQGERPYASTLCPSRSTVYCSAGPSGSCT